VYKIIDLGKLKYDESIKRKQQKAQARAHKIKEIKIGLLTEQHDLNIKAQHIHRFLEKGHKVKVTMKFKGRQLSFGPAGLQKMQNLIRPFIENGIAIADKPPAFDGNNLIVFLTTTKK
jgi:translation initiation factor IF-3